MTKSHRIILREVREKPYKNELRGADIRQLKNAEANSVGNGFGIASFVLSIFGLLFFMIPFFDLILSILAIVFANKQRRISSNGLATSGLVMGIIGTVINSIYSFFFYLLAIYLQ